jgi:Ca2+-binding RTX toxin-like protein
VADPITLAYDLDAGTRDVGAGVALDTFRSSVIRFDPVTLVPGETLRINLDFLERENDAPQQMEVRTLGEGGATNAPTTFATRIGAGHVFGPGFTVGGVGLTGFEQMTLEVALSDPTSAIRPDFTDTSGAVAGHGGTEAFEFSGFLPDLTDDPFLPIGFDGLTLDLRYLGGEATARIDSLAFNVISAEVAIRRAPPEVERRDEPVSSIFNGTDAGESRSGTDGYDIFHGRGGDDSFFAGDGPDVAYGGEGNDILVMGAGQNFADGGAGNDTITASGSGGSVLLGGEGNDSFTGSFDNDVIDGGAGSDVISSLHGNDVQTGGAGGDTFVLRGDLRIAFRGIGDDAITDFQTGLDRIEIETFSTPGFSSFANIAANLADGPNGAVLTVGDEGTVTFLGLSAASLSAADFSFDGSNPVPVYGKEVDWEAVAADVEENFEETGQWWVTPGKFPESWGVG